MALLWLSAYAVASNERLTAFTAAACVACALFANATREYIYSIAFAKDFSRFKTDFRIADHPTYWWDVVSTSVYIIAIGYVGGLLGILHCRFDEDGSGGLWRTILDVSADYWTVNLIKDNVCMRYLHPWMHKRENYWLHKRHHVGNKDLSYLPGAFLFDTMDLTIEFGVGSVLGIAAKYFLLGKDPSLHVLAIMFSVWTDGNAHSMNPYSQAIGNPILDWFMKLTLCHNLHHAIQKDPRYMTAFPMHQLFSAASLEEDVQTYNKIMKTHVDYRIFLDG